MEIHNSEDNASFFGRLRLAFRVLFDATIAQRVKAELKFRESKEAKPSAPAPGAANPAPERVHASGLLLLAALQREGRLIDFLQQDIAAFSDEEVGAAARVVHAGCSKMFKQYFEFHPAVKEPEGSTMTIQENFDAQRIRLTGNVTGQPPFRGLLKHHGWVTKEVRLPAITEALDPRIIAPAEVELQ